MGQLWGELARNLADSLIIPFDVRDYSRVLQGLVEQLNSSETGTIMRTKMSLGSRFTACFVKSHEKLKKKEDTLDYIYTWYIL